jgi:hypothetical protein
VRLDDLVPCSHRGNNGGSGSLASPSILPASGDCFQRQKMLRPYCSTPNSLQCPVHQFGRVPNSHNHVSRVYIVEVILGVKSLTFDAFNYKSDVGRQFVALQRSCGHLLSDQHRATFLLLPFVRLHSKTLSLLF